METESENGDILSRSQVLWYMYYWKDANSRGRSKNMFEPPHWNTYKMQTQEKVYPPRHGFASQKEKEKIIIDYKTLTVNLSPLISVEGE